MLVKIGVNNKVLNIKDRLKTIDIVWQAVLLSWELDKVKYQVVDTTLWDIREKTAAQTLTSEIKETIQTSHAEDT